MLTRLINPVTNVLLTVDIIAIWYCKCYHNICSNCGILIETTVSIKVKAYLTSHYVN